MNERIGVVHFAGFALMLLLLIWAIFFAQSKVSQSLAIFAGAGIAIALMIGRAIAFAKEIGIWPFVRNFLIIAGLFVLLIGGYTFRHDAASVADRMMRELNPTQPTMQSNGTIALLAGEDGHYRTRASVNGTSIVFMIDTGATSIVLAPNDAHRIGIDMASLSYDQETETANGIGRAAVVSLDDLQIGDLKMKSLPARVNAAHMSDSLLGMEFLRRLRSWRVEKGVLLLEP